MKQIFTLLVCLFLFIISKAHYVTLPDTDFKTFLMQKYPGCFNASGQLDTTCSAIRIEDSLEFHKLGLTNGINLEGIQYFTSLKYLNCYDNLILASPALPATLLYLDYSFTATQGPGGSILPAMPNTLRYLNIDSNYFTSVTFPDSLRYLNCSANFLYSLPAFPTKLDTLICINENDPSVPKHILATLPSLPNTLKYLDCSNNALTSLPALPASLTYLNSSWQYYTDNGETSVRTLVSLPALPSSLTYLNCYQNELTSLPSLPPLLIYLNCAGNKALDGNGQPIAGEPGISSLPPLPMHLQTLLCNLNQLTALPDLPSSLKQIDCSYNDLTTLPPLPDSLIDLNLQQNLVSELPANLPSGLSFLDCALNNITCMPHLPASIAGQSPYQSPNGFNLIYDEAKILCIPNTYNNLKEAYVNLSESVVAFTPALCTPVNNANQCVVYPVISGITYYDNNSNGIQDANEEPRPNAKVRLSNGMNGFSNVNGYFELSADTGNYTLTIDPPKYYNAVPATVNHTFNSYDTLTTDLISLQPNASVDSVSISLVPYFAARPGFNYNYTLNHENTGTTTVSPSMVIDYDAARLTYQNSSNPSVVNNGSSLGITIPSFTPGQKGTFTVNFTVNASAALGDTLFGKATVTARSKTSTDSVFTVIGASHDPNEKLATPSLTTLQVASGTYINYEINFQNTGTDTAFDVLVTDTLSSMLQANTFQIIGSSHPCRITQNGNVLIFEFLNISLPDSSANNTGSLGYIKFRIKPQTSLSSNIDNTANIYFDYNTPVLTNTARTSVALNTLPVQLVSFKAMNQQNGTALLYWNTANETGIRSFTIEQSFNGSIFESLAIISSHGAGNNTYIQKVAVAEGITYYRLAIKDVDGHINYSGIIEINNISNNNYIIVLNTLAKELLYLSVIKQTLQGTVAVIINSNGITVKTFLLKSGNQNINISNLPAGNYYLRTQSGTKKFIIIN